MAPVTLTLTRFLVIIRYWLNYRFRQEVPLFNPFVLCNLCDHRHKSLLKLDFYYISVAKRMGLALTSLTQLALDFKHLHCTNAKQRPLRRLRSFKVTDFGTKR